MDRRMHSARTTYLFSRDGSEGKKASGDGRVSTEYLLGRTNMVMVAECR